MAADYWASHASASLASKQHLLSAHREDRARGLTDLHIQQIKAYFVSQIWELARVCKLRYRVAATAAVYFRKFYLRNSFGGTSHDPRLVHVGCLYLASKTEETLLQAKHLIVYVKRVHPTWPYDVKHLLDSEMVIIQDLDFMLIVYHAYRPLVQLHQEAGVPQVVAQQAWAALNDLYRCDAPLMYAPHVLALGCILYAWASRSPSAAVGVGSAASAGTLLGGQAPPAGSPFVHPTSASPAESWDCITWLHGVDANMHEVTQVAEHLAGVYRDFRTPISNEECKRLLDVAVLPLTAPDVT